MQHPPAFVMARIGLVPCSPAAAAAIGPTTAAGRGYCPPTLRTVHNGFRVARALAP